MITKRIGKLATVAASAALTLQLFAGASAAAVPNGSAEGTSSGTWGGDGWAAFTSSYHFADSSTLSKLYLEIDIDNAASLPLFTATREGNPVKGCDVTVADGEAVILCTFKTVRNGDDFVLTYWVDPAREADVNASGNWSSTGFVPGGNSSHGDAWEIADSATGDDTLTVAYDSDPDHASGFGNSSLSTKTNFGNNKQYAILDDLPAGKFASVNDNAGGSATFPDLEINVNNGQPAVFKLLLVYPKGTSAPKTFEHTSSGYPTTTYTPCAKRDTSDCFVWNNKTSTVTFYLSHNGQLRRTS